MMLNLRSKSRKALFGYFFTNPHAEHYLRELARLLDDDAANLSRELRRLCEEGVFVENQRGNQKHFRLNRAHPLYREMKSIAFKTVGVVGQLREMLSGLPGVEQGYLFGSFARQQEDAMSDIDVLIIGTPPEDELALRALELQRKICREINYTVMSPAELRKRNKESDPFIADLWRNKRVELLPA